MFAKAKARVRQFAGMDQVTSVDPVMDARFTRFQGMEKGLSTVYDAMGAYFAAHKALSRTSTELSAALQAYHMDAIKAYSEHELDNAVESSDACDSMASEARTSAMVTCNAGLDLCRMLDAQAQECASVHEAMLKDVMIRPVAAAIASLRPLHDLKARHQTALVRKDAARSDADVARRALTAACTASGSSAEASRAKAERVVTESAERLQTEERVVAHASAELGAALAEVERHRPYVLSVATDALFASLLDQAQRTAQRFGQAMPCFPRAGASLATLAELSARKVNELGPGQSQAQACASAASDSSSRPAKPMFAPAVPPRPTDLALPRAAPASGDSRSGANTEAAVATAVGENVNTPDRRTDEQLLRALTLNHHIGPRSSVESARRRAASRLPTPSSAGDAHAIYDLRVPFSTVHEQLRLQVVGCDRLGSVVASAKTELATATPPATTGGSAVASRQVSRVGAESHATAPDQLQAPPRPPPAQTVAPVGPRPRYVVTIHEYQGQESNDLHFGAGQLIEVLQEKQSGWWRGRIGQRSGVFPVNFTRPARDDELSNAPAS